VTVAVWVGYDNARGKQTLGRGSTGGHTAVPIVEPIIQATWNLVGPKTLLPPPSAEAARHLKALPIDYASGQKLAAGSRNGFTEYFKLDANRKVRDTQYALAGRHSLAAPRPMMEGGPGPGPVSNMIEQRPQYVPPPSAGGRLPPSNRVPRNLRELFGM
jgi:membrane carboxypeptidase/penicillin-binding protein